MARATSPGSSWPPAKTIALSSHRVIRERAARLVRILPIVTGRCRRSIIAVGRCRHGFRLLHSRDQDAIHEFIVEAHQTLDPPRLMHRAGVVPDHFLVAFSPCRPMVGLGD